VRAAQPSSTYGDHLSPRTTTRVAWGICAVYWVAVSAGYALQLSHGTAAEPLQELGWRLGDGSFATIGAVIVSRRPRHVIGWILCVVGITGAVAGFAQDYAAFALLRRQEWLPGGLVMGWLGSWPWYIAFGLLITFLLLLFPDGRLPSRRWRPVAWAAAADIAVLTVWAAFAPRPFEGPPGMRMPQNPWGIERAAGLFQLLSAIAGWALLALTVLSLASLVLRFRRSRGEQRQQLKWFTYAALLTVGAWLIFVVTGAEARFTGPLLLLFTILSFWLVAAAIGVAILRYHLYDIDRLINRTLVYALLTLLLAGVYAGAVLVLGQLFGDLGGEPPSWAVAASTLAVAALFQPARRRIQMAVDRRFNRRRYDAAKTIDAFAVRLRDEVDLDMLSAELLAVVDQTMQPTQASLWLRPSVSSSPSRD
jgi:MFS family permease